MNASSIPATTDSADNVRVKVRAARSIGLSTQCKLLAIPLVVALSWWAVLGGIALLYANPTTINLIQIRRSDRLTRIRTSDPTTNKAEIVAVCNDKWTDLESPESVTINNLSESDVTADGEWIVPLTFINGEQREYSITTFKLGSDGPDGTAMESPPYVYPANDQSAKLIEDALKNLRTPVEK